jgi:hypothetical protein
MSSLNTIAIGSITNVTKREYVRSWIEEVEGIGELVHYDDAKEFEKDGATYYQDSESEAQYEVVMDTVRTMAENMFDRLHDKQGGTTR